MHGDREISQEPAGAVTASRRKSGSMQTGERQSFLRCAPLTAPPSALRRPQSHCAPRRASRCWHAIAGAKGPLGSARQQNARVIEKAQRASARHVPVRARSIAQAASAGGLCTRGGAGATHNRTASRRSRRDSASARSIKRAWTSPSTASSCDGGLLGASCPGLLGASCPVPSGFSVSVSPLPCRSCASLSSSTAMVDWGRAGEQPLQLGT